MAGRPTKFEKKFVEEGEKLSALGLPQKDMAYFWAVSEDSITRWKEKRSEFADALKRGEAKRKISLLQAMHRNATERNNAAVQIFLAKNWLGMTDKQEWEVSGEGGGPLKIKLEEIITDERPGE